MKALFGRVAAAGLMVGVMGLTGCAARVDSGSAGFAGLETVAFEVDGMACENCAVHIAEELAGLPGVKAAAVDFKTRTAKVGLDPANPATMESLEAAVAKWKKEHFEADEDPECLDPEQRERIRRGG